MNRNKTAYHGKKKFKYNKYEDKFRADYVLAYILILAIYLILVCMYFLQYNDTMQNIKNTIYHISPNWNGIAMVILFEVIGFGFGISPKLVEFFKNVRIENYKAMNMVRIAVLFTCIVPIIAYIFIGTGVCVINDSNIYIKPNLFTEEKIYTWKAISEMEIIHGKKSDRYLICIKDSKYVNISGSGASDEEICNLEKQFKKLNIKIEETKDSNE